MDFNKQPRGINHSELFRVTESRQVFYDVTDVARRGPPPHPRPRLSDLSGGHTTAPHSHMSVGLKRQDWGASAERRRGS